MSFARTDHAFFPSFGGLLLGRHTYEDFYNFWPKQTGSPFTEMLNNLQKYVVSRTLTEPLAWMNSTLLKGSVPEAMARLKTQPGGDLIAMGSGELVQTLMEHNLVDRYVQLIHPLGWGRGAACSSTAVPWPHSTSSTTGPRRPVLLQ